MYYLSIGLQESSLSNVFFVAADIDNDLLVELVSCMEKHNNSQLLGQRIPKRAEKGGMVAKALFPYSKLKCIRGEITSQELLDLVRQVNAKEISYHDMERELTRIKEMRALQNFFVKYTNCSSWENAKNKLVNIAYYWYTINVIN